MTDINKELVDILLEFLSTTFDADYECDDDKRENARVEAIAKIKALVVESLPKERKEGFDDKNWSEQYGEMGGWNDCLGEIRSIYGK